MKTDPHLAFFLGVSVTNFKGNLLRTKDYERYCERYKVEVELSPAFEEPAEEIRNMMHMWPLLNMESGVIMHILKLCEFKKG